MLQFVEQLLAFLEAVPYFCREELTFAHPIRLVSDILLHTLPYGALINVQLPGNKPYGLAGVFVNNCLQFGDEFYIPDSVQHS